MSWCFYRSRKEELGFILDEVSRKEPFLTPYARKSSLRISHHNFADLLAGW